MSLLWVLVFVAAFWGAYYACGKVMDFLSEVGRVLDDFNSIPGTLDRIEAHLSNAQVSLASIEASLEHMKSREVTK